MLYTDARLGLLGKSSHRAFWTKQQVALEAIEDIDDLETDQYILAALCISSSLKAALLNSVISNDQDRVLLDKFQLIADQSEDKHMFLSHARAVNAIMTLDSTFDLASLVTQRVAELQVSIPNFFAHSQLEGQFGGSSPRA